MEGERVGNTLKKCDTQRGWNGSQTGTGGLEEELEGKKERINFRLTFWGGYRLGNNPSVPNKRVHDEEESFGGNWQGKRRGRQNEDIIVI